MSKQQKLRITNPRQDWVLKEFDKLIAEWEAWAKEVDQIQDQPIPKGLASDTFKDGKENILRHQMLQEKTRVFLDNNVEGHNFIHGFDGKNIDRKDLRLKIRVEHRLNDIHTLKEALTYRWEAGEAMASSKKRSSKQPENHPDGQIMQASGKGSDDARSAQRKSLKQRWEENELVFVAGLMCAAFVAGWGSHNLFAESIDDKPEISTVNCRVEGMESVENGHRDRIKPLIDQMTKQESQASDPELIVTYQRLGREAAERIRGDIEKENSSYQTAIKLLTKKCE